MLSVVEIFITSETALGRMAQQIRQGQLVFLSRRASVRLSEMSSLMPRCSANSQTTNGPASQVTRNPYKSTFKKNLEESSKRQIFYLIHWVHASTVTLWPLRPLTTAVSLIIRATGLTLKREPWLGENSRPVYLFPSPTLASPGHRAYSRDSGKTSIRYSMPRSKSRIGINYCSDGRRFERQPIHQTTSATI